MSVKQKKDSEREARVFINYRHEDTRADAGRLYDSLSEYFGSERIFMDISAIKPGSDFAKAIEEEVTACEAVLVVIGRQWLDCSTSGGGRRIDDPNDFVYIEIASALSRDALVIPVLVGGASMPREQDLPDGLKPLARRQALELSDGRWEYDTDRLLNTLEENFGQRSGGAAVPWGAKGSRRVRSGSTPFGLARYWQMLPVRLVAGLLVLGAALAPQLRLAYRPEAVSLEETGKFTPVSARLGREMLTIESPSLDAEGLVLAHVGNPDEMVDFSFERARLDGDTLMLFSERNPPANSSRIDYVTTKPAAASQGEPCRTFIQVRAADTRRPPSALHFSQQAAPGGEIMRALELKADGDVLVSVDTDVPDESNERAPGCAKLLKVAPDFVSPVNGASTISVIAEADSAARFSFNPATAKNDLWEGAEGLFQPFALGNEASAQFRARGVEIISLGDRGTAQTTLLSAHSLDGEWLNIESLSVGSDRLQIKVSGMAFVKVNGDDYVDPLGRMRKHPLATILLVLIDAALLVWFIRLLFLKRQPMR